MKFYSEITKKLYDSAEEVLNAESEIKRKEEEKAQKKQEQSKRKAEIEKAVKEVTDLIAKYLEDYGSLDIVCEKSYPFGKSTEEKVNFKKKKDFFFDSLEDFLNK